MAFKFVAILALASVAAAGVLPVYHEYAAAAAPSTAPYTHHAPPSLVQRVAYAPHAHTVLAARREEEPFDAHPQYKYSYDVQDELTGDSKSQAEQRDGDVVTGEYSLIDADGYRRVVQYTADAVHGFNAVVNRIPLEHHVQAKAVVKAVAPAAAYAHAPAIVAPAQLATYHEHH